MIGETNRKNSKGFTLIELLLSISIFAMMALVISGIYVAFSRTQAISRASQKLLNESQYAMEVMAREIRNNTIFDFDPTVSDCNAILGSTDYDTCIILQRESGQLTAFTTYNEMLYYVVLDCNSDYSSCSWTDYASYTHLLSSGINQVRVKGLDFEINPNVDPYEENSNYQPRVTIRLATEYASSKDIEEVNQTLQTTVSSRVYKR